jgi:hypothetical protein
MYWNHGDALEIGMADPDENNYQRFLSFDGKTIGVYNNGSSVFIGEGAGSNDNLLLGDHWSVGIGNRALEANILGLANTAVGYSALRSNLDGNYNVAIGSGALWQNRSSYNTAVGTAALNDHVSGGYNLAMGYAAGARLISGSRNVFIGNAAGFKDTLGYYNTVVGDEAMFYNEHGSNNTIIGSGAGLGVEDQDYSGNVLLGFNAGYYINSDNKLYIENSSSSSPLIYGEFDNNLIRINGHQEITENLSIGTTGNVALRVNSAETIWYNGTYLSWGFGANHNYFAKPVRMGPIQGGTTPYADLQVISSTASDVSVVSTNGDAILQLAGNGADSINHHWTMRRDAADGGKLQWRHSNFSIMTMTPSGNLGIGVTAPTHQLQLSSDSAGKPGGGSWSNSSDRRLKQNVNGYHDGLSKIQKIRPVTFQYNELSGYDTEPEYVGVIAQELQEVAPYMVSENETGYLDVNNSAMTYMLVNAVQEQQEMIKALQEEVASLKATVESIKN